MNTKLLVHVIFLFVLLHHVAESTIIDFDEPELSFDFDQINDR